MRSEPTEQRRLHSFQAIVIDIREESRIEGRVRWHVLLDHSDFAPGSAGTLQATARSGARLLVPVLDVQENAAGELWHVVEKPLATGTPVTCTLHNSGHVL